MYVRLSIAFVLAASTPALAQHDHAHEEHRGPADTASLAAGAALVAAGYDTMLFAGTYQGLVPAVRWSNTRFAALASGGAYRVTSNGAEYYGIGDIGVHGQATLATADAFEAGVIAGVSLPTGNERHGMGMGHAMVMPAVFAAWSADRVHLAASVGYSRALGGQRDHDHGAWPIVSPMLMAEVSWSAGGDVRVTPSLTAGARASGGVPAGEGGPARAILAGRVAWRRSRVDTAVELQAGVVGDPFNLRGVVTTMLSF